MPESGERKTYALNVLQRLATALKMSLAEVVEGTTHGDASTPSAVSATRPRRGSNECG